MVYIAQAVLWSTTHREQEVGMLLNHGFNTLHITSQISSSPWSLASLAIGTWHNAYIYIYIIVGGGKAIPLMECHVQKSTIMFIQWL